MTDRVTEAVKIARQFFQLESFPGNFFDVFEKNENILENEKVLLFKEDIGKLSGFIGYGEDDIAVICINYNRSIGHQNFTLAHEVGHWIMHKGKGISDEYVGKNSYGRNEIEDEANEFAVELLYPYHRFEKDIEYISSNNLMSQSKRKDLGIYIDTLCHLYCLSFELVLRKILVFYEKRDANIYKTFRGQIEKALGGKISKCFEKDFYVVNHEVLCYKKLMKPYEVLENKVNSLQAQGKIGQATAESIKFRNGIKIE